MSLMLVSDVMLCVNHVICCVTCQKEKKTLDSLRLDLDAAKTKLRRAKTQPGKEAVSILLLPYVIM